MSVSKASQLLTSSDGTQIYADTTGDPSKQCLIFIHGLALSGVVFDNIFSNPEYATEFYLVRYDMRGHGRSGKPDSIEGYSSQLYADDFSALLKAFKITKPIVIGWSMGATVLPDIATYLPPDTLAGAVYLAALPYIGPVMGRVGTPAILGFLPGLTTESDVVLFSETATKFADSLFVTPENIPWETKCLWIGMAAYQTPQHRGFILSRPQDPEKFFALGQQGFPLLIVNGTQDGQVIGSVVVEEMKPHFKNLEVCMIEKGGSHAIHYENEKEVMWIASLRLPIKSVRKWVLLGLPIEKSCR